MADVSDRFCNKIVWLGCFNDSGDTIPPFGCVMMTGWALPPDISDPTESSPYMLVDQPDGSVSPEHHYFNGPVAIPPDCYGAVARPNRNVPLLVALSGSQNDPNDVPYRMVGPSSGSWQAARDTPGFAMVAQPQAGYALVVPTSGPYVAQVPGSSDYGDGGSSGGSGANGLPSNSSGPVDVFWATDGTIGDETDTSVTVTVYNRFSSLNPGDWLLFDWSGQGWEVVTDNQSGSGVVRGALTDILAKGGSAPFRDLKGKPYTVSEVLGINDGTYKAGTRLDVARNPSNGLWEVIQPLQQVMRGTLDSLLSPNGTSTITASDARTYTVVEVNGSSFQSGQMVEVFFNNWTGQFEVISSPGATIVRGTISNVLKKGGNATLTDAQGNEHTVHEVLGINGGSYKSGTTLTAFYNDAARQWEVMQPLPQVIRGTLTSLLSSGGTSQITATDGNTYAVVEVLGLGTNSISSGTKVVAFFNNDTGNFEVMAASCSPAR
jgi:hypothetical protein